MGIPILEYPQDFNWGTKYEKLYKYCTSRKLNNFKTIGKLELHNSFGFYFESLWKDYTYKATMNFNVKSECLTHVDVVIPGDNKKFDLNDFARTFKVLKKEFGEPNITKGMPIEDLMKDKRHNYMGKDAGDLPEFVWILEGSEIIHHFIDYWGNGPVTTIRKQRQ